MVAAAEVVAAVAVVVVAGAVAEGAVEEVVVAAVAAALDLSRCYHQKGSRLSQCNPGLESQGKYCRPAGHCHRCQH